MKDLSDLTAGQQSLTSARPTWVRWRIVALLVAFSFLSWFIRVSMPVAYNERLKEQFDISPAVMGYVYSALLAAYALCMTPGGWFIDRFGTRVSFIVMGFGLTLFGALTGLVGSGVHLLSGAPATLGVTLSTGGLAVVLFLGIRFLMGVFAAPMYPAAAHAIAGWVPFHRRNWANGLVQAAACLGIAATPLFFGKLIDWFDWPQAFLILAVLTSLVTMLWAAYATDRPEQHAGTNAAERHLIETENDHPPEEPPGPSPTPLEAREDPGIPPQPTVKGLISWEAYRASETSAAFKAAPELSRVDDGWGVFRNRSLLCLTASYAAVGYFEYLFFFWMDYYFKKELQLPDEVRRVYSAIPLLAMAAGMVLGGFLSDWFVRMLGVRRGRGLVPMGGMLSAAAFLIAGVLTKQPEWIVLWFSLALGAMGAVEPPTWTTAQELGGRRGGLSAGICNTGGNLGGIVSPIVTPLIADLLGWGWAIALAGLVCLFGVCLWHWVDPLERVEETV
jgi:MFS family permease